MDFLQISQNLVSWFWSNGAKAAGILVAAFLANWFSQIFIGKAIRSQVESRFDGRRKKRAETLISVFGGTLRFVIYLTAALMILPEFGINITPILAGVGVLGLAVGMAARDVISDFLSGFFIVLEGQYEIGDRVKIAGVEGEIREITLRRTSILDESGLLHSIPNSQIKTVSKKYD